MTGTVSPIVPLPHENPADEPSSPEYRLQLHDLVDYLRPVVRGEDDCHQCLLSGRIVQCVSALVLDYRTRLEATYPLCCTPGMTRDEQARLSADYQELRQMTTLVYDALDSALRP